MAEYDNNLTGALFKNKDKDEAHPKWPDYKGSCEIDGKQMWISAWLKKDKNGNPYMSLAFNPKDEQQKSGGGQAKHSLDDDIPFAPEFR